MTMNSNMQGFDGVVAWNMPGTRAAFRRWTAWNLAKSLGWVVLWWGTVYLTLLLPAAAVIPMVLVLLAIAVLACLAFGRLGERRRMRRILAVYPWRQQSGAVRITKGEDALLVLPNPDRPETTVSLKVTAGLFRSFSRDFLKDYHGNSGTRGTRASRAWWPSPIYVAWAASPNPRPTTPVRLPAAKA
ncbi:hypothetical protein ABZ848_45410 [Streptomyces sp. NPDC047081]|uniref:hypothetical protein n=1 Tax=Streptomyces sp. NPDC047081 TaxID=3154706 RepID=UPI0033F436BA